MVTVIKKNVGGTNPWYHYAGLSTDTKPVNAPENSLFSEIDTGKKYYTSGNAWYELPAQDGGSEGSGSSGSSLPSMTGKNGKVLGVTLDAQDHEQAEWVTPSGGGAEKFVVTLTADDSGAETVWTADKTIAEIVEAYEAEQVVVAKAIYEGELMEIPISWAGEAVAETNACIFTGILSVEPGYNYVRFIMGVEQSGTTSWMVEDHAVNSVPDYSSLNNGQVLGVSSGSLAWVDNYASLIVTMTEDSQNAGTYVGDKTYSEVTAAMGAGRTCFANITGIGTTLVVATSVFGSNYIVELSGGATSEGASGDDYVSITLN